MYTALRLREAVVPICLLGQVDGPNSPPAAPELAAIPLPDPCFGRFGKPD
jgi:hypothetical protein